MKASDFKNIIKEAVREAIREELTQIQQPVQENVRPAQPVVYEKTGNAMLDVLNETRTSMSSADYQNIGGGPLTSQLARNYDRSMFGMKNSAYTPGTEAAMQAAPKVGLDIANLSFLKNAAEIVKVADQKQKEKNGL